MTVILHIALTITPTAAFRCFRKATNKILCIFSIKTHLSFYLKYIVYFHRYIDDIYLFLLKSISILLLLFIVVKVSLFVMRTL